MVKDNVGLNINQLLHEDMVFLDLEAKTKEELLGKLSTAACEAGYVKDTFLDAVLERESLYPTALPTQVLRVAVPHAVDRSHVIRPVIVLAKLKHPVLFKEMGEGINDVPVDVVFLLAVNGPKDQLTILQQVVGMFSNPNALEAIKEAGNKVSLIQAVKTNLGV
ncbi:MAG: PTS sugar transporter subunit IIA [Lawsonibacter sp.]|nr:PTS sugar transporter subunit IIA [Lawsonibacter sp.]